MQMLDRLAQILGGGIGGGVDPNQQREAARMALMASGLSTIQGAGSQGIDALIPGLMTGLDTFQGALGDARQSNQAQQRIGLSERRVNMEEQQYAQQQEQDQRSEEEREEDMRFLAERLAKDRPSGMQILEGWRNGPQADDPVLSTLARGFELALPDERGYGGNSDEMFRIIRAGSDRITQLTEEPERSKPIALGANSRLLDPETGEVLVDVRTKPPTTAGAIGESRPNFKQFFDIWKNAPEFQIQIMDGTGANALGTGRFQTNVQGIREKYDTEYPAEPAPGGGVQLTLAQAEAQLRSERAAIEQKGLSFDEVLAALPQVFQGNSALPESEILSRIMNLLAAQQVNTGGAFQAGERIPGIGM